MRSYRRPCQGFHRHPRRADLCGGVLVRQPPAGGPYRIPEVIAIASIMLPALWWFKADPDNGFGVLVGAATLALAVTIVLRIALPKQRPSLATRTRFMLASLLPRQQCAAPPQTRSGDVPQR